MKESLIYKGIAATSIKYIEEDIENLLNREINLREKDISKENGYLGAIQGMPITQDEERKHKTIGKEFTCTWTQKNLDREVTSAIELSMEQCEVKPQIGSLVGKEFGHVLHSNTIDVSIRNAYSSMALHLQDLGS